MDLTNLVANLDNLQRIVDSSKSKKTVLEKSIKNSNSEIEALQQRKELLLTAREFYKKAIDNTYNRSIQELESLLNDVVGTIFYDKNYSVKMDLSDKHNKSLSFWLYDADKDLYTPLSKPGTGRGVKTVVSAFIYAYYLLKFKSPYMFLDESFVNIDASYISNFFSFMKELCKDENLTIVLISHDERFIEFADKRITVNDGNVVVLDEPDKA